MQIDKLEVENFRGFNKKEFILNPSFTVAIGDNGTGKSTLLHAMQVAAGSFFLGLPNIHRRHIEEDEIRISFNPDSRQWVYHTPTKIKAIGSINGSGKFSWQREIPEYGKSTSSKKADVGRIRSIAEEYVKRINTPDRPMMPVIAFFGVRQLGGKPKRQKRTKIKRVIVRDGYYNALGSKSDESSYTEWFYYYEENLKKGMEFEGTFQALINAIEKAIPFLKNVSFDRFQLQIEADCEIPGQAPKRLLHSLMSDGLKRMLGIVADIAYRCVVLNGYRGEWAIEETQGIVMIDELDMHLHPNWQRHVVSDLKRAFPKIQFLATTHSPFVVQSLKSDELISLDFVVDIAPNEMKIDEVATDLMGVKSAYSEENAKKEERAKKILGLLDTDAHSEEVEREINDIPDPGLRAFLQLNKMAKGK
ncbi:MAG TPA: AAA family ATPase [Puia sp.]|jgi:predicted ATP-binding protein involved in virulence|nr:AAA family ATPase [Puia sp.]